MDENSEGFSLRALQAGDRAEFARLVDRYSGPIYRLALKMLGNSSDAEDVLQNTFLKAFQHLPAFEGRSSLSTWLYRIASNEALMLIRKRRREVNLADAEAEDEQDAEISAPVQLTDWCCLPEEEFLSDESQDLLNRAVQRLPERLRIVFILRDLQGLSIQEAGEALGLSETAVKTRLLRARLRLREDLSAYYAERLGERSKK